MLISTHLKPAKHIDTRPAPPHDNTPTSEEFMKSSFSLATAAFFALSTTLMGADTEVKLTLDTAKTGAPISKYIYGQFVEHLGRSIYGGLWAEMLEDRKFGHEIVDDYQP